MSLVSAKEAKHLIDNGATILDIRDRDEYAREHIKNALNVPLSELETHKFNFTSKDIVVAHCQIGKRSSANRGFIEKAIAPASLRLMDGGLNAWKAAHYDTVVDEKAPLPLQRQVQLAIGGLLFTSVMLTQFVSRKFLAVPLFISCGLMFAGATGTCMLGIAISKAPWNQVSSSK